MATDRLTSTIEWFEADQVPGEEYLMVLCAINHRIKGECVVPGEWFSALDRFTPAGDGATKLDVILWAYMPDFPKP